MDKPPTQYVTCNLAETKVLVNGEWKKASESEEAMGILRDVFIEGRIETDSSGDDN